MRTGSARLAMGAILLAIVGPTAALAQTPPQRGDDPAGAARYFLEIRAYPLARIPAGARQAALAQMRARWPSAVAQRDALMTSTPNGSTTQWTPLGPAPLTNASGNGSSSGRLNSIAIHPNGSTIYVGGAQGGVWRTTDGGATWTPLTDSECSLAMGSIAIDPTDPNIVYAGTGELNNSGDSYYGCGVLRSSDGGAHWTQLGRLTLVTASGIGGRVSKLVIDASHPTTILAAMNIGLYRSTDSGLTWTIASVGGVNFTSIVSDIVQDPNASSVFYAAAGNVFGSPSGPTPSNGVYKSTDGGASWTKLTGNLPTANVGRINLAISTGVTRTVFAAIELANSTSVTDGQLLGLYVSLDDGATWTQRTASGVSCSAQCWYSMAIAVDPGNPQIVYFGGLSLYRSLDGGQSFIDITNNGSIHVDQHAIAFDPTTPSTIYAGNDGGIFKSTNGSSGTPVWTNLNTNLALTQFYAGISVSPIDANTILGGTQDNGTLEYVGGLNWPAVIGADGGFTAIDQLSGGVMFGETQWTAGSGFSGPRRKDPPGSQFIQKTTGINTNDKASFIPPLVMDPFRPRMLYFGTQNLYRTGNSGDSWTVIGPNLVATTGVINAIGVAPSDTLTLYVGSTDARVSYTHDGGATWTTATGLPNAPVTDFAVDARDARTAVVVFGIFLGSHVWKTVDGGVTWTNLTLDLPNTPTLAVVLEPGSQDIDIGTDIGVFTLRNGATSWSPVVNGLPNVAVYDLIFDTQRSRLIAATHGRGMFSLDVTVVALRGDITNEGTVGILDAQAILASVVGLPIPGGAIRYPNGDANCDGQVTAADALLVLMKVAGMNTGTACVGTSR